MGTLNTRVGVTREPERGAPEMGAWALHAIAASSLNSFVSLSTSSPSAPSLRSESTCETPRPSDSLVLPSGHHSTGGPSVSIFPCRGVTQVLWVPRSRDPLRPQRVSQARHTAPRLRPRHLLFPLPAAAAGLGSGSLIVSAPVRRLPSRIASHIYEGSGRARPPNPSLKRTGSACR